MQIECRESRVLASDSGKVTVVAHRIGKFVHTRSEPSKISYPPIERKASTMAAIQSQSEVVVKPKHLYDVVAVWCLVFSGFAISAFAQKAPVPTHVGVPQDWSDRHIVFSRDALARHPDLIFREPRIFNQAMQRWRAPNSDVLRGVNSTAASARKPGQHRDWNVSLGTGKVNANMFPAKYSFNPATAPDCVNDYVVFGLTSSTGDANLVAFNNLYSTCTGALPIPNLLFAYNIATVTGGRIDTSPILSLDGTKIAFVESVPGATPQAIFHVLTWTANQGTITAPATPTAMSSLTYSSANDTSSSPWIDYGNDIVYVGDDGGSVYQITGVFNGTPALSGLPWPVAVSTGYHLTPPVLDSNLGVLMVGSANGNLYQVNTTTGAPVALVVGDLGSTTPGIVATPIVDIANGVTFVVTANNGTSAVLEQVKTSTNLVHSTANIGQGSTGGPTTPPVKLFEPTFNNNYYNDPSSGLITLCGTGPSDTTPYQYAFGFSADGTMSESPSIKQQLSTTATDRCTGAWTEFFNPNVGLVDTITATSVASDVLTVTASNGNLTVGEQVFLQGTAESFLNGQTVTVTSLLGAGPTYTGFTASFTASDYTNPSDTGTVSVPSAGTDFFFFGLSTDCTAFAAGATGCVVDIGVNGSTGTTTTAAAVAGGTSGIIIDNYGFANIYFGARGANTAFQFTQNGLN